MRLARCALEFPKEGRLEFSSTMVACLVTFENFVHLFEQECPELRKRPIVTNTFRNVCGVVVIGSDDRRTV